MGSRWRFQIVWCLLIALWFFYFILCFDYIEHFSAFKVKTIKYGTWLPCLSPHCSFLSVIGNPFFKVLIYPYISSFWQHKEICISITILCLFLFKKQMLCMLFCILHFHLHSFLSVCREFSHSFLCLHTAPAYEHIVTYSAVPSWWTLRLVLNHWLL